MIYVVHPLGKSIDLTQAQTYGGLFYVNNRYVYSDEIDDNGKIPFNVVENIRRAAHKFDPDRDYLLIAGDHLQLVTLASEISVRKGWYRVLRYDRVAQGYVPISIFVS